jgi:hypothetical protein
LPNAPLYVRTAPLFAIGEGPSSAEATITPALNQKVTVTPAASAGALGWRVYWGAVAGGQSQYLDITAAQATAVITALAGGTPGYFSTQLVNVPLSLPQRPWEPISKAAEGGFDVTPSGAGEAYVIRWLEGVTMTLRILEWGPLVSELDAIRAWWKWASTTMNSSTYNFDQVSGPAFTVFVDAPTLMDGFTPTRVPEFRRMFEQRFTLRVGDNVTPMSPPFYVGG